MAYSPDVVEKVRAEFEKKRQKAIDDSVLRQNEVYAKCPVVKEIDNALSLTGLNVYKAALEGPDGLKERIEKLKNENLELQRQKRELLKMSGFPEDYTDIKYECTKCNDEGFLGIDMCTCLKSALSKASYESSGLGKMLSYQSFDNFKLTYYSDKAPDGKMSDREIMKSVVSKAKAYVKDFGKEGKESNLLFIGGTGLGKTHLTTAIAKGIIEKGYNVVYESAQNIVHAFESRQFGKDAGEAADTDKFFNCDLLIIDDLGTEFRSSFTQSVLYNLINTRINSAKCMIISTNLDSTDKFIKTYDERIASRLFGSFRTFAFVGKDIRVQKVQQSGK